MTSPETNGPGSADPISPAPIGSAESESGDPGSDAVGSDAVGSDAEESGAAPAAPTTDSTPTGLGEGEIAALQLALQAENAALWSYALVAANNTDDRDTVAEMRAAHRVRRDATASMLADNGADPQAPAVAYDTPGATDQATSRTLAVAIEADCELAWRNVVANTDNNDLRSTATAALTDAAVRFVRWKLLAGAGVPTTPFPGRPAQS